MANLNSTHYYTPTPVHATCLAGQAASARRPYSHSAAGTAVDGQHSLVQSELALSATHVHRPLRQLFSRLGHHQHASTSSALAHRSRMNMEYRRATCVKQKSVIPLYPLHQRSPHTCTSTTVPRLAQQSSWMRGSVSMVKCVTEALFVRGCVENLHPQLTSEGARGADVTHYRTPC